MLSPLRSRFGIPGVISVIALVFAMLGGAYAANNSGGGKATASAKAKKGPRGPKGATGPAGPTGPAGANGKDGASGKEGPQGPAGPQGPPGTAGPAGAAGKSVTSTPIPAEPTETLCKGYGGAEYLVEDALEGTTICNGEEGSPWTDGGTLPPGATETGFYFGEGGKHTITTEYKVINEAEEEETKQEVINVGSDTLNVPISFPIPMATNVLEGHVFHGEGTQTEGTEAEFTKHCPGLSFKAPAVLSPGDLCIYENPGETAPFVGAFRTLSGNAGAALAGAFLRFALDVSKGVTRASGSFAVKGCSLTEAATICP
jgi:hypothetical protein